MTTTGLKTPAQQAAPQPQVRRGLRERWARVVRPPRVAGLDLARGLAIIGMIAAHVGNVPPFELGDPSTWAGVVHGRSSLLFALVAGVSLALMTRGARTSAPDDLRRTRLTLVGRGTVILVLGVLLELVGSPVAIILGFYGAVFVLVAPVVGWSTRRLAVLVGLLVLVAGPLVSLAKSVSLMGGPAAQFLVFGMYPLPVWLAFVLTGLLVGRGDLASLRRAGALVGIGAVLAVVGYVGVPLLAPVPGSDPVHLSPGSSHVDEIPGEEVDLTGFTCTALDESFMSCWKTSSDDGAGTATSHVTGTSSSERSSVPMSDDGPLEDVAPAWWRSPVDLTFVTWPLVRDSLGSVEPHSGGLGEVVGSGGFVLAVLGLCLMLGRPRVLRLLLVPVAALGSMPLTVYSLHVTSFLVPRFVEPAGIGTWLAQTVVLLLAATLWALTLGKGPLERMTAWVASRYAVRTSAETLRTPSGGDPGRPHLPGPTEVP